MNLEAKSFEFLLDHKTHDTFNLKSEIPDLTQEQPFAEPYSLPLYCKELKIENIGEKPLKNCFPYVNQPPCMTLEDLAARIADADNPLLGLYHLWMRSVVQDDSVRNINCHPLDLLNFKGACSSEDYSIQFIKLCNALGIETRLANVQGKTLYDFCVDDEWNLLDLTNQKMYIGLNNERLVSSEEIMDDPFLALRTKHDRQAKQVDFVEGWKELAHFEILEPSSALPVVKESADLKNRATGFDLYPKETLVFKTPANHPELSKHQRSIEHTIHLESRQVPMLWKYQSPIPIRKLVNKSSVKVLLLDQKVVLNPGESVNFKDKDVFHVSLEFASVPKGKLLVSGRCAPNLFPHLVNGQNQVNLGAEKNRSIIRFHYELDETIEKNAVSGPKVLNEFDTFDYCSPYFQLGCSKDEIESIWWQISPESKFQLVPSNFDQVESFTTTVTIPSISETFLNAGCTYYFRIKGCSNGTWSDWSAPYAFTVNKPAAVEEVEFDLIDQNWVELNWERCAEETDEPIEYLVFGSNSLDFVPSIYCEKQVNAIVNGEVTELEANDNLVAIANQPKVKVPSGLAYYRIVAKQRGQLSVPSTMIHVYDQDFIQPRNILQVIEDDQNVKIAKRSLFPASYPWTEISLPHISVPISAASEKSSLVKLQMLLRSATKLEHTKNGYESPDVSEEVWEEVRPYLLPPNHPAWAKMNRVFCKTRATQSPDAFKKAGFKRWRPGRWSRVSASSHPEFQEYFIKAYCDCELGIMYDWKKWIHRIKGAETIRDCIKKYKLSANFKVPHKWIYPLPKHPSPPKGSRYLRKNFILVCENMRIQDHDTNEKMYKKNMTKKTMEGIYTILQVCGLYDSVYCFNIPYCKDGKIAVIDTEYHHKWPVPFQKLRKSFSEEGRQYWDRLTHNGGKIPDGKNQHNPPRMDRRDVVPPQKKAE